MVVRQRFHHEEVPFVRTYETVFITLPTLTEDEERTVVGAFAQVISDSGANFVANERMGRRRLAYPIRKFEDGVYTRFLYDAAESVPREIERRMRISDKVLRHLTIHLEREWAVGAKEQAVRDAQERVEAEVRRVAAEAEAARLAAEGGGTPEKGEATTPERPQPTAASSRGDEDFIEPDDDEEDAGDSDEAGAERP